jgi:hypothetical protein
LAVFLNPADMVVYLGTLLGDDASPEDAAELFDRLVLRGQLRPWQRGLWELDSCINKGRP